MLTTMMTNQHPSCRSKPIVTAFYIGIQHSTRIITNDPPELVSNNQLQLQLNQIKSMVHDGKCPDGFSCHREMASNTSLYINPQRTGITREMLRKFQFLSRCLKQVFHFIALFQRTALANLTLVQKRVTATPFKQAPLRRDHSVSLSQHSR